MTPAPRPTGHRWPHCLRLGRAVLLAVALAGAVLALAVTAAGPAQAASGTRAAAAASSRQAHHSPSPAPSRTVSPSPSPSHTPSPSPSPTTSVPPPSSGSTGGCGWFDFTCDVTHAITGWFAGLVTSAVNPLLSLIGETALSTPQPGSIPAVSSTWTASVAIADVLYVLLVLAGGVLVMSHETLQTSYSVKEIAPRIVCGFVFANLSMVIMTQAITLANALSAALAGHGITPGTAARSLVDTLAASASSGGIFLVLLTIAGVVLAVILAFIYVLRLMAIVLLAAAAPLALASYALPQLAWLARWWWRALAAVLSIQIAQGLVLTASVQVFFSPGWLLWDVASPWPHLLVTLCLLYIMIRIPFWISRPVLSPFGGSPVRRAARFAFTAAVLSRVGPVLRGTAGRPRSRAGSRRSTGARPRPGTGSRPRPGNGPRPGTGNGSRRPASPARSRAAPRPRRLATAPDPPGRESTP
jgi:hypothetical protein